MTDREQTLAQRKRVLARVRELLIGELKVRREPDELDPDSPLFGTGLRLDSVDAVELVVCVEAAFGLHLPEGAFGPAPLRTINTLVDFILEARADACTA